ncbi:hypothetical protein F66182_10916 [Fusarium sp. NRRL 66182]|nr:hypothetical protein F66182_10916 [Fusarium sp. NRRL 66182]
MRDIHLRSLSMYMDGGNVDDGDDVEHQYEQMERRLQPEYRFICSFNTLTSLELINYNRKIRNYNARKSFKSRIPRVSAASVNFLVSRLPRLETFQFAPEEQKLAEISKELLHAKSLKVLNWDPHPGRTYESEADETGLGLPRTAMSTVLETFLINADSTDNFVWEDHYKLRRLRVNWDHDYSLTAKKKSDQDLRCKREDRQVWCHSLVHSAGSGPYDWIDKVAGNMTR